MWNPAGATLLRELERVAVFPYSILFIRHGETSYNAVGRLQGQRDISLNGKGREQASAVGRTLKKLMSTEIARLDAAEAYRIGLINRIAAAGEGLTAAITLAELIAQRAPLSVASSKAAVEKSTLLDLQDGLAFEQELAAALRDSHDRREGLLAFTERRPPKFTGT